MIESIPQFSKIEEKIQYPEGATKEMIEIATKVVLLLAKNGFLKSKLGTDYLTKDINRLIKFRAQQMVNHKNNIKDQDYSFFKGYILSEYHHLCNPRNFPNQKTFLTKEIMDRYVELLGYRVKIIDIPFPNSYLQPLKN